MATAQVRETYRVNCPNNCGASAHVTLYECGCMDYVMINQGKMTASCDKDYFSRYKRKGVGCK